MHSTRSSAQRSQPPPSSSRPASRSVACLPYLEEIVIYVLEGVPTASIKVDCTNPRPGNPLYLKRSFSLPSISLGLPFRWSERLLGLQPDIAPTPPLGGGKKGALHALKEVLLLLLELLLSYGTRVSKLGQLPYLVGDVFGPSLLAKLALYLCKRIREAQFLRLVYSFVYRGIGRLLAPALLLDLVEDLLKVTLFLLLASGWPLFAGQRILLSCSLRLAYVHHPITSGLRARSEGALRF